MFNLPFKYKFVQRNKTRWNRNPYQYEYIFRFFVQGYGRTCRRKLIVEVKQYSDTLFTVDFYATISAKQSKIKNPFYSKYRYTTNAGNANRVAATVFVIIGEMRQSFPEMSFGFQAATMFDEGTDTNNKRFKTYKHIMQMVTGSENSIWAAFAFDENSFIFVLQKKHLANKDKILIDYGKIFDKTF